MGTRKRLLAAVAVWLLAWPAGAALETVEEIEACIDENLPDETSRQRIRFEAVDRADSTSTSDVRVFWKKFPDGFFEIPGEYDYVAGPEESLKVF